MADAQAKYDLTGKRVWIAGHRGMVGSALVRRLEREDCELLTVSRDQLDLRDPSAVRNWLSAEKPDAVFLAAARVGGIMDNATLPADFLRDNLMIAGSVIPAAADAGVEKLVFLGSSCIYPREAAQPISESALLTGPLEETNRAYAVAKIAGLELASAYRMQFGCDFVSAMPTNLYGPNDNFDLETSHVMPALMVKALKAKAAGKQSLTIWGSGRPRREFLHVDDCADGLVHILKHYSDGAPINLGTGQDIAIADLAKLIMNLVGLTGEVITDPTRPDGTLVKRLDVSRLSALGWDASIDLNDGIQGVLDWINANPQAVAQ